MVVCYSCYYCPLIVIFRGQYKKGTEKYPTVVLEAITSADLWFWHHFFGVPGSCNDLNVLDRSTLLYKLFSNSSPNITWTCNGTERTFTYFLADGIYPAWKIFMKPISKPFTAKKKNYSCRQEAARKDVERAFGVLQSRFRILAIPARVWNSKKMAIIIKACVILHNMIVADSGYNIAEVISNLTVPGENQVDLQYTHNDNSIGAIGRFLVDIENKNEHYQLRNDLVEHLWHWAGEEVDQ